MVPNYFSQEEIEVGISEFLSKGNEILATTKYLLSDFIVNEINLQKNVVFMKEKPRPIVFDRAHNKVDYYFSPYLLAETEAVLGKNIAEYIEQLYEKLDTGEKVIEWTTVMKNFPNNREERIKIHTFVREKLTNIDSTTMENGQGLRLSFNRKLRKMKPYARKKYIHFKLFKSNIDTNGAIYKLSKLTGISQKVFSTAGLKDKRGITTQMVAAFNTDIASLRKFYDHADRNRYIWIDEFVYNQDINIAMGDLYGNQFGLILRLIDSHDEVYVEERINTIRYIGMINYFGLQRFGSCGTKTHLVGVQVLKKYWKELIEGLLFRDCGDFETNKYIKEMYEKEEFAKAERGLNNKFKVYKMVFKALARVGKNFSNVFESLPRSFKSLYLHALQSYIWNKIVSRRLREHGLQLVVGDLVGTFRSIVQKGRYAEEDEPDEEQAIAEYIAEDDNLHVDTEIINQDNLYKFTIHDLIAPLYGPNSIIPYKTILFYYIQDELQALGLINEHFVNNMKMFCMKGQSRKLLIRPNAVSYKMISHQHPKDELQSPFYLNGYIIDIPSGDFRAIQISLQLPKSSYATMAIRYILHLTSSFSVQMELNRKYYSSINI